MNALPTLSRSDFAQPARQLHFHVKVKLFAVLFTMDHVTAALQLNEDQVNSLIDERRLAWAWDIGLGKYRSEVRVLARCVSGFQATGTSCNLGDEPASRIIGEILAREHKPYISGSRLRALFRCSSELINDLIDAGELEQLPNTNYRRGRNGSAFIEHGSVIRFLQRRKIS